MSFIIQLRKILEKHRQSTVKKFYEYTRTTLRLKLWDFSYLKNPKYDEFREMYPNEKHEDFRLAYK